MSVTLPATGKEIPDELADFTVTSLKTLATSDGVAFTATLRYAGKIVGAIENQGTGGDTRAVFNDGFASEVAKVWDQAMTEAAAYEHEFPMYAHEIAPEWLINEYENRRIIDRATKKGETVARRDSTFHVWRSADVVEVTRLEREARGDGFEVWTGTGWAQA